MFQHLDLATALKIQLKNNIANGYAIFFCVKYNYEIITIPLE